jgi:hypothetical protein
MKKFVIVLLFIFQLINCYCEIGMYKILNNKIYDFKIEGDTVWACSDNGKLLKIQFNDSILYIDSISITEATRDNNLYSIAIDKNGIKWISTEGQGIFKYNGSSIKNFTTKDGLSSNYTTCIAIDQQNQKWIGTEGNGVSIFNDTSWSKLKVTEEDKEVITNIQIDANSTKWISTYDGIYEYHNSIINKFPLADYHLSETYISTLIDSKGVKWFGLNGLGIRRDDGTNSINSYNNTTYLFANNPTSFYEDSKQNVWASDVNWGFSVYCPSSQYSAYGLLYYSFAYSDINNVNVSRLDCDTLDKPIWIGNLTGLYYIGRKPNHFININLTDSISDISTPEDSIIADSVDVIPIILINDWLPFHKDQYSYYLQKNEGEMLVETFIMDSTSKINGINTCLFNTKAGNCDNCYNSYDKITTYNDYANYQKIPKFTFENEDILFHQRINSSNTDTILFKPNSKIGDSWTTHDIKFICSYQKDSILFDEVDSIKVFTVYKGIDKIDKVILSKNHGLLRFPPFNLLIQQENYTSYELIGYKKQNIRKGYQPPSFEKFLTLKVGDILAIKDSRWLWEKSSFKSYAIYLDSILSLNRYQDSIVYYYKRQTVEIHDEGWTSPSPMEGIFKTIYYRNDFEDLMNNGTSWPGRFSRNNNLFYLHSFKIAFNEGDTLTTLFYNPFNITVDTINGILPNEDYEYSKQTSCNESQVLGINKKYGFEFSTKIIGYRINGKSYGVINNYTPTNSTTPHKDLISYSNPVFDYLYINGNLTDGIKVKIYDLNGSLLLNSQSEIKLNISDLPCGIYILQIMNNNDEIIKIDKLYKR